MLASSYGWTVEQILDLTTHELNLLSASMLRRYKATMPSGDKTSTNWKRPKKLEDSLDAFKVRGLLDDG